MASSATTFPDLTDALAAQAAELSFEDLPETTVRDIKCLVLDSLGTILAATKLGVGTDAVLDLARAQTGKPEATVIGFGDRLSTLMATLANGGLVHALNYDAVGQGHLGSLLPGPLAVAEQLGGISGREFITALAAGAELTGRMNRALHASHVNANEKFLEGTLLGVFGITAATGKLLNLTPVQMTDAYGVTLMQCAGSMQVVASGDPPVKAVYSAFSNHSAVLSAMLAQRGLGARMDVFEGRCGFFEMYYESRHAHEVLYENLGSSYTPASIRFKTWPTGGGAGAWITAGAALKAGHGFTASDVERVTMFIHPDHQVWMEPMEERRHPAQSAAAANGIVFWTAKALANGTCGLADLSLDGLNQPEFLRISSHLDYTVVGESDQQRLEVLTTGGQALSVDVNPLNNTVDSSHTEEIVAKFRDSASWSVNGLSASQIDELAQVVMNLESVGDVSILAKLASAKSHA
jgi:2-methylcitrate dehydratase PrpD